MASKAPPIPPDQRSDAGDKANVEGSEIGRRDATTGVQSNQPGNADINVKNQGRFANRRQNVDTVQHKQQDR
jgi:hypothetical protein